MEILRMKNDPKYAEELEFEKQKKITEARVKALRNSKKIKDQKGPFKVNLKSIGA